MAHLFLQQDPKVSVANAEENPTTIPTPEQLGSFLVTTDASGNNGKLYTAVEILGVPTWVLVGFASGGGGSGFVKADGTVPLTATWDVGGQRITGLTLVPVDPSDAASVDFVASWGDGHYLALDGSNAMAANLNMGTHQIVGLVAPTNPTDGANKAYVDAAVGAIVHLSGNLSNDVATAPGDAIGTRPLASSVALGSTFAALDSGYNGLSAPHPITPGAKVWRAFTSTSRVYRGTSGLTASTQFRMGVYVPGTGVFTQCAVAGQFCNAVASGNAIAGATMLVALGPGLLTLVTPAAGLTGGAEFMSDATGQAVPYVVAPGNVPLGIAPATINAGDIQALCFYDW